MFKSASVLGSLAGSSVLGPEAIAGELAILGGIIAFRKIKQRVEDKRQRKSDKQRLEQQQQQDAAEAERQWLEIETQRQEAERQRQEAERQAQAERQRQAEQLRQDSLRTEQNAINQARINENQQQIDQAQAQARNVENSLEAQREERIRLSGRDVQVSGYAGRSDLPDIARWFISPAVLQNDSEPPEDWRYISGNSIVDRDYPNYSDDAINRQRLDPPPPNGGGNGGNGDPSGPNNPRGDPNGGFPNNNIYRPRQRNPYADLIDAISKAIQKQKNDEKDSVENVYEDDQQPILGQDPATWSPTGKIDESVGKRPGQDGGGIYNPQLQKEDTSKSILDNQHITQQEIEAMLAAQGELELTEEEQLAQLYAIQQQLTTVVPQQVRVAGVYSQEIRRF